MINGPPWRSPETARTERAAIKGWGPTLRLLALRVAPTTCWALSTTAVTLVVQQFR